MTHRDRSPTSRRAAVSRRPYHAFADFARARFGGSVFRVVVDAGFSCPVRDGTLGHDGCLFCSIEGFRPPTSRPELTLDAQVERALPFLRRRYPRAVGYLVYFQPYTNTHGDPDRLASLIVTARRLNGALGVIIGTRPDALPDPTLEVLASAARDTFLQVELGVQSTSDRALAAMERKHDWAASARALGALKSRSIRAGAHLILGTPWESRESQIESAALISRAGVDSVKLHHLQIMAGSRLARRWAADPWPLLDWRDYVDLAARFLARLDSSVVVERLFSTGRPSVLIAPRWPVSADRIRAEISDRLAEMGSQGGVACA